MTTSTPSESEIGMCQRLTDWGEGLGFTVYPEVNGWDLVFVSNEDRKLGGPYSNQIIVAGQQVGIHAKLRPSCEVLMQADCTDSRHGPGYPFVAVPLAGVGFRYLARRIGVGVIATDRFIRRPRFSSDLDVPEIKVVDWLNNPSSRTPLTLPPIATRSILAGSPSPRVLSTWRVNALRFLNFARARETVTASQLVGFGISKSFADRWLEPVDWTTEINGRQKPVRVRTYTLTSKAERLPDWGYGDVAAELLKADRDATGADGEAA